MPLVRPTLKLRKWTFVLAIILIRSNWCAAYMRGGSSVQVTWLCLCRSASSCSCILSGVPACIDWARIVLQEWRTKGSSTLRRSSWRLEKERRLPWRLWSGLYWAIFLCWGGLTHDRGVLWGGFLVLFEVALEHIFLLLHFLLDLLIEILVSPVIVLPDLLVLCHNYN